MLKLLLVLLAFQNSQQTEYDNGNSEYAAIREKNDKIIINTLVGVIVALLLVVVVLMIIDLIC